MPRTKRKTKIEADAPQNQAENYLPLLQGTAAALLVATVLFSGESLVRYGSGHLLTVLWFLLAAACAGWNFLNRKGLGRGNLVVFLFFLWVAISSGVHLLPGRGCVRFGLNAFFLWMGLAAAFYVFRTVLNNLDTKKAFLAILVSLAVSEAVLGFYQYAIERPQLIRQYESNQEETLAVLGITPGSPEHQLIENRIRNTEPTGTYPLTNTLAGVLAPALVLLVGLLIFGRHQHFLTVSGGLLAFLLGLCLLLTQSRTGCVAVFCGLLLLAWKLGYKRLSRKVIQIVLLAAVLVGGAVSVAIFTGGLNIDLLAGAKKSLGFRLEYWESTAKMIQDRPWFGCGAGNYQHIYTQYKLPNASEEIADPHNFVMEIASNFGLPAILCFLMFLVGLCMRPSQTDARGTGQKGENYFETFSKNLPLFLGALLGFGVAFFCTQFSEISLGWQVVILAAAFVIAVVPLTLLALSDDLNFLVKATIFVLLVNLLAAGGIAYPNVAISFWLLAAVLLPNGTGQRNMTHGILGVVFLLLVFACYNYSFLPALRSSVELNRAQMESGFESQIKRLQKAVQADPFSVDARLALTQARFALYEASGSGQVLKEAIKDQETLLRLAPFSASVRKALGEAMLRAYDRRGNREVLSLAVKRFEEAVEFYPNHAKNRAPLAVAYWKAGEKDKATIEAKIAIEMDDSTPHLEQKLSDSLRAELEAIQ